MPSFEKIAAPSRPSRPSEIDPDWRKRPRFWTPERLHQLDMLMNQGLTDARIATKLGCTVNAVNLARKRYWIEPRSERWLSARAVAAQLGLGCSKIVVRWIEHRWLRARRGWRRGPNRVYRVAESALLDFLRDPAHWHCWDPDRIPDPSLREWTREMRAGVRFLTLTEVAARFHVERGTVAAWLDRGYLPSVDNGNRLIRESDLIGFVSPGERSKRGQRQRRWTEPEDRELLKARERGWTWQRIALYLGRSLGATANRWYRLSGARSARGRAA